MTNQLVPTGLVPEVMTMMMSGHYLVALTLTSLKKKVVSEKEDDDQKQLSDCISVLHWVYNWSISKEPEQKMPLKQTTNKPGFERLFKTPMEATLAIFLIAFWEIIMMEIYRYAEQKLQSKKGKKQLIACRL